MIDVATPGALPGVSILDLGLASLVRDPVDPRLEGTQAGAGERTMRVGAGTPGWMAPEQIRNPRTVDQRADMFAIGAIANATNRRLAKSTAVETVPTA